MVQKRLSRNEEYSLVRSMQASLDDLVTPSAHREFESKAADCKVIRYEDCKHEIFNATDDIIFDYYKRVLDFYE